MPRERLRFATAVDWSAPGPDAVHRLLLHVEAEFAREDGMAVQLVAQADAQIGLAEVATAAGCSVRSLQNAFRLFRGTTPHRALQLVRLERAREALRRARRRWLRWRVGSGSATWVGSPCPAPGISARCRAGNTGTSANTGHFERPWVHIVGSHDMAVLRMTSPQRDPRTGMVILRRRVPRRYLAVADQAGGIVKISTGHKDERAAMREWPNVLRRYAEMEAEWERRLNVVDLTPERAKEIAAHWASWVDADLGRLPGTPEDTLALDDGPGGKLAISVSEDPGGLQARGAALLEGCALEAASLAGITVAPETIGHLRGAMRLIVVAAYRQASLGTLGSSRPLGRAGTP